MKPLTRRQVLKAAAVAGAAQALSACVDGITFVGSIETDALPADASVGGSGGADATPDAGGAMFPPDAAHADAALQPTDAAHLPDGRVEPDAALTDDLPRYEHTGEPGPADLFQHGVASGDPGPEAVILWTRLTGVDAATEVFFEVSQREDFSVRAQVGTAMATPERDFTVKVDATALKPARTYFYRFFALGRTSEVGRMRTAPESNARHLRLAVVSCASYAHGYFHTFRELSTQDDLDAVVHLGDSIYEGGNGDYGDVRDYQPPHACVTLEDYRRRYRYYREDPFTRAAHGRHAFIPIWDDHEFCNGAWRDGSDAHDEAMLGPYADRKAAAMRAFMEWQPIREAPDGRIFRTLEMGGLVDLMMLDTRAWGRDRQDANAVDDASRSLLGADQETWLSGELRASQARWRLVAQQVMMGHLRFRANESLPLAVLNFDQWDGYPAARQRLFDTIRDHGVNNVVVLAGDIHSSWAMELTDDPNDAARYNAETSEGALAVEFVAPSITSPGLAALQPALLDLVRAANPHVKWVELRRHGWMVLDITPERMEATFMHFETIRDAVVAPPTVGAVWQVRNGSPRLEPVS